jgi:hypothetical protein
LLGKIYPRDRLDHEVNVRSLPSENLQERRRDHQGGEVVGGERKALGRLAGVEFWKLDRKLERPQRLPHERRHAHRTRRRLHAGRRSDE